MHRHRARFVNANFPIGVVRPYVRAEYLPSANHCDLQGPASVGSFVSDGEFGNRYGSAVLIIIVERDYTTHRRFFAIAAAIVKRFPVFSLRPFLFFFFFFSSFYFYN